MGINVSGSAGGKGSGRRPSLVDREKFDSNWDAIFGKKKKTEEMPQETSHDAQEASSLKDSGD